LRVAQGLLALALGLLYLSFGLEAAIVRRLSCLFLHFPPELVPAAFGLVACSCTHGGTSFRAGRGALSDLGRSTQPRLGRTRKVDWVDSVRSERSPSPVYGAGLLNR